MKARDNPLRVERIERLIGFEPGWVGTDWDRLLDRLHSHSGRGAVVGPHGSGKTTLLGSLAIKLAARDPAVIVHQLRLANQPDMRFSRHHLVELQAAASGGAWIMIDGAEQIGPLQWQSVRRVTAAARGLVITRHRRGRLPLLLRTYTTPEMLERCLEKLLKPGSVPPGPGGVKALWQRHRGNLREALWEVYDLA